MAYSILICLYFGTYIILFLVRHVIISQSIVNCQLTHILKTKILWAKLCLRSIGHSFSELLFRIKQINKLQFYWSRSNLKKCQAEEFWFNLIAWKKHLGIASFKCIQRSFLPLLENYSVVALCNCSLEGKIVNNLLIHIQLYF